MSPPRKTASEESIDGNVLLLLGEIKGQLRELIHSSNNMAMKVDALAMRVSALEAADHRRAGAAGVVATILKSPAIGWLVGAAVSAWAILTGKVHL